MNLVDFYRAGNWLYRNRIPFVPHLIHRFSFFLYNSDVPPSTEIGAKSRFSHGGIGVIIHRRCKIGNRVMIGCSVTIGGSFGSDVPQIGNNVLIGPGARLLGALKIGDNVVIGANAVVLHDVPSNTVVAGIPAKQIGTIDDKALDAINGTWIRD